MNHLLDVNACLHLASVLDVVDDTFQMAMKLMNEPARTGAALTIINLDESRPLSFTTRVGRPPKDKAQKYDAISIEKARRLLASPHDESSYQSRDPDNDKWGGAIKSDPIIISISGFHELWDEAIGLILAVRGSSLRAVRADLIAAYSKNPHFEPLLEALPRLR